MARSVTLNNTSFSIPQTGDSGWSLTGGVDDYLVALATGVLTKSGGAFTLTADVDFGASFGLKAPYFRGPTPSVSTTASTTSGSATITVTSATGILVGQTASGTGIPANTTVTAVSGTTITLSQNATATGSGVTVTFATNQAGSGVVRLANQDVLAWRNAANSADLALTVNGSNVLTFGGNPILTLALGAANTALTMNSGGTAYAWTTITNAQIDAAAAIAYSKLNLASSIATTDLASGLLVPVGKGGTGLTGGISGGVPYYSGASTLASSAALAANAVVIGGGAGAAPSTIAAGTADQVLVTPHLGGAPVFGQLDLSQSAAVKNQLGVANGGTGLASGTSGGVLAFTASGTLASSAALTSNGVVLGGGAGVAPSSTAAGTADQVLVVPHLGGAPAFGQLDLSQSAAVKNQLPVANGGTGIASGTSGGVPYFSGSTSIASSAALTANQLIVGGGAGAAPATLAAGSQYQVLSMGISNPAYGALHLDQSAAITGTLGMGNGGTGVTSVTTSPTASAFAGWDANKNLSANNHIDAYATTATAAGTTTLTAASPKIQYFTGTTTQTVKLPDTSTLVTGFVFRIVNNSTGTVTVQSNGLNTVQAMAGSSFALFTCVSTSVNTAAAWDVNYSVDNAGGGTVTSVAATVPSGLAVAGSPITTAGTLALSWSGTIPSSSVPVSLNSGGSSFAGNTTGDSGFSGTGSTATITSVTLGAFYYGTSVLTFNGNGFSASQNVTINWTKVGKLVTLHFPGTSHTGANPGNIDIDGPTIGTNLQPVSGPIIIPITTADSGTDQTGAFYLSTGGVVRIYKNISQTGAFTNGALIGFEAFSVSYMTA